MIFVGEPLQFAGDGVGELGSIRVRDRDDVHEMDDAAGAAPSRIC